MTKQKALQKAKERLQDATVEVLKEAVIAMNENLEIDPYAFELGLEILESRISEDDFIAFCETL